MSNFDSVIFSTYPHSCDLKLAVEHTSAGTGPQTPHVMFCGGFHSAMQGTKAKALKLYCQQHGWSYTRFDYRGHGQSEGDPAAFTLTDWLDDTLAVLDSLPKPTLLIGSSMGAWLATCAALRQPDAVVALLLLAAAPDFVQKNITPRLTPGDIWDLQQGNTIGLANQYDADYPITQAFLDSAETIALLSGNALESLGCPVRLVHGTADTDVSTDLAVQYMDRLVSTHDARLTLLHKADHRLSDERSLSYIYSELNTLVDKLF